MILKPINPHKFSGNGCGYASLPADSGVKKLAEG